jgi:hypothetical protein
MIKVIGAWAFRCGLREKGPQEFIISEKAKGGVGQGKKCIVQYMELDQGYDHHYTN